MSLKKLKAMDHSCREALSKLEEGLILFENEKTDTSKRNALFDGVVKRFEVLFEYAWKLIKAAAEYQGQEAPGPRPAIQEALRFKWIDDAEFWADALDARNGSVHDYFGFTPEKYHQMMKKFVSEVHSLLQKISRLK